MSIDWRKLRRNKDLTQKELADIVGISGDSISNYETGKHEPKFDTALSMLRVLGYQIKVEKIDKREEREIIL